MIPRFQKAFIIGVERLSAWSDILDGINVFPVADGDTGRNLILSLTPLRNPGKDREEIIRKLLLSARGNSGNIAVRFITEFLKAESFELLPEAAKSGRDQAWQAVHDPKAGTMLTVFDGLVNFFETNGIEARPEYVSRMIDHLEEAVRSTPELLPKLKVAGVVDAGALGMFIFLDGFFRALVDRTDEFRSIPALFKDMLEVSPAFQEEMQQGYCVDMVLQAGNNTEAKIRSLSEHCEAMVVIPHEDYLKIHLHTQSTKKTKHQVESMGDVVQWLDDNIEIQIKDFNRKHKPGAIHIMADAAGSVTRTDSRELGFTLLDSYINAEDKSLPESLFSNLELYRSMRKGSKFSTSQASVFERHQCYQRVVSQYPKVLYLCVGSVFTGNYDVATEWKGKNDHDNRLTIIDTGAASGRLGAIVIATARYSAHANDPESVIAFARRATERCKEYIFLDTLKYLAAGGRLSKPGAFFGDMLHVKPIISPTAEGAKKVGAARNQDGQLRFALERLRESLDKDSAPFIMLEYSDNRTWVSEIVLKKVKELYPLSEVLLQPLSLTSGVHMGPGTWAMAFLPES